MEEFLRGERLGQVVNGAGLDGLDRQLGGGVGGDHEEGDVGPAFAGLGQELVAAHLAQAGVGDDHEELLFFQGGEGLLGGFDHLDVIALAVQDGLQGKAHVPFVVNDQDGRKGQAHVVQPHQDAGREFQGEAGALSQLGLDLDGAAVHFGVMFDNGQTQAGALGAGGEIGLENLVHFVGRDARAVVGDGNDDGILLAIAGGDFDFAAAVEGLAGVLEQIDQHAGQVLSLHEDGGKIGGVIALDADLVFGGGGKDLQDGVVNFGGHFEALDAALGQLGVAHQHGRGSGRRG